MLRRRGLGEHFRREHQAGPFYLDFYSARIKLAIEVDGAPHFVEGGKVYDERRTEYLETLGIRVIRFENSAVISNPEASRVRSLAVS